MNKRTIAMTSGAILTFALQSFMGGCSGASSGSSQVPVTKEQKLGLINKVPMSPGAKQKLTEQIQQGRLKGP